MRQENKNYPPPCLARKLDLVEYEDGLTIQSLFAAARRDDLIPDSLLLLEHPHVFTVGRRTSRSPDEFAKQILAQPDDLARLRVEICETDRGGAVTYHGPGQLVAYPILKLSPSHRDVHRYLRDLEDVIIATLADFGIAGCRVEGRTGVWVQQEKIASIGVHLSRWVTTHGLALNVNNDLSFFDLIIPCGLKGVRMTSMERILGGSVGFKAVQDSLMTHFARVFQATMIEQPTDRESVQVVMCLAEQVGEPRSPLGERYLLLRRKGSHGGFWQPITGFIEEGESPRAAAQREVYEHAVPARAGALIDLSYVHSFAIDPELPDVPSNLPVLVREHSFACFLNTMVEPIRLDPGEHEQSMFADFQTAIRMIRWKRNRRALLLTEEIARRSLTHDEAGSVAPTPPRPEA